MKYIKKFENIKKEPEKGDYVVVKFKKSEPPEIAKTLEKYIGKIDNILFTKHITLSYNVKFGTTYWWIDRDDVLDWSKNKKDLEHYIQANKYNI